MAQPATIDFSVYNNVADLRELLVNIEAEIERRQDVVRTDLIEQLQTQAAEHGMTIEQVLRPARQKRPRKKQQVAAPRYRNPADPSKTWVGTGRKPKWLIEALAGGAELSDFASSAN